MRLQIEDSSMIYRVGHEDETEYCRIKAIKRQSRDELCPYSYGVKN
jgi:hypothetical protein